MYQRRSTPSVAKSTHVLAGARFALTRSWSDGSSVTDTEGTLLACKSKRQALREPDGKRQSRSLWKQRVLAYERGVLHYSSLKRTRGSSFSPGSWRCWAGNRVGRFAGDFPRGPRGGTSTATPRCAEEGSFLLRHGGNDGPGDLGALRSVNRRGLRLDDASWKAIFNKGVPLKLIQELQAG